MDVCRKKTSPILTILQHKEVCPVEASKPKVISAGTPPYPLYAPQVQTPDLLTRVQQAVENGDISQIQTHLKQLLPQLRAEGQNPLADYLQVQAHLLAGDLDKARIAVESLDLSEPMIGAHAAALKSQVYQFLGAQAAEKGDYQTAYEWAHKALAAAPSPALWDQVLTWQVQAAAGLAPTYRQFQQARQVLHNLSKPPSREDLAWFGDRQEELAAAQKGLVRTEAALERTRTELTQRVRAMTSPTLAEKLQRELMLTELALDAGDIEFARDILASAQAALKDRPEDAAKVALVTLYQREVPLLLAQTDFGEAAQRLRNADGLVSRLPEPPQAGLKAQNALLRAELNYAETGDENQLIRQLEVLVDKIGKSEGEQAVADRAALRLLAEPRVDAATAEVLLRRLRYHADPEIASQALWLGALRRLEAGDNLGARDLLTTLESEYPQTAAARTSRNFGPLQKIRDAAGDIRQDLDASDLGAALRTALTAQGNPWLRAGVYALGMAISFPWGLVAAVLIERTLAAGQNIDAIQSAYQTGLTAATPARVGQHAWLLTAEVAAALAGGLTGRVVGKMIAGEAAGAGLSTLARQVGASSAEFLANDLTFRASLGALTGHDTRWRGPEGFAVGMLGALLGAVKVTRAGFLAKYSSPGRLDFATNASLALGADYLIRLGFVQAGHRALDPGDPGQFAAHGMAFMLRVKVSGDIFHGLAHTLSRSVHRGYDAAIEAAQTQLKTLGIEPKAVTPQGIQVAMTAVPALKGSGLAKAPVVARECFDQNTPIQELKGYLKNETHLELVDAAPTQAQLQVLVAEVQKTGKPITIHRYEGGEVKLQKQGERVVIDLADWAKLHPDIYVQAAPDTPLSAEHTQLRQVNRDTVANELSAALQSGQGRAVWVDSAGKVFAELQVTAKGARLKTGEIPDNLQKMLARQLLASGRPIYWEGVGTFHPDFSQTSIQNTAVAKIVASHHLTRMFGGDQATWEQRVHQNWQTSEGVQGWAAWSEVLAGAQKLHADPIARQNIQELTTWIQNSSEVLPQGVALGPLRGAATQQNLAALFGLLRQGDARYVQRLQPMTEFGGAALSVGYKAQIAPKSSAGSEFSGLLLLKDNFGGSGKTGEVTSVVALPTDPSHGKAGTLTPDFKVIERRDGKTVRELSIDNKQVDAHHLDTQATNFAKGLKQVLTHKIKAAGATQKTLLMVEVYQVTSEAATVSQMAVVLKEARAIATREIGPGAAESVPVLVRFKGAGVWRYWLFEPNKSARSIKDNELAIELNWQ